MVAENEVLKEFASRELSRRHLLPFIQRCHPGYMAGWVHHELCERLEAFAADVTVTTFALLSCAQVTADVAALASIIAAIAPARIVFFIT